MKQDMIVILDLGSHENTVVARAIRALGVYSEIYPHDITAAELKALPNVKGIVINGGKNNVIDGVEIDVLPEIYEAGFPVIAAGHDKALCEVKLAEFADDEEAMKEAVSVIKTADKGIKTEASGNMSIPRLIEVAATGVDFISVGALTHTVKGMDISMNIQVDNQ